MSANFAVNFLNGDLLGIAHKRFRETRNDQNKINKTVGVKNTVCIENTYVRLSDSS